MPASVAGGLGATLTNGGETLHQGFEFTARVDSGTILRSDHNFYFRSAYTWLPDAKFTGQRLSSIPGFTTVSVTGNRLPYAPEHLVISWGITGLGLTRSSKQTMWPQSARSNTVTPTPTGSGLDTELHSVERDLQLHCRILAHDILHIGQKPIRQQLRCGSRSRTPAGNPATGPGWTQVQILSGVDLIAAA